MSRPVTLNHVARVAGVSPSTVSRIMNGTAQVAPEKRVAVMEAIERLGYRPNAVAQGLARGGKSLGVGVIAQEISSPFYGAVLNGIEQGLAGSLYHPIFASGHWRADQEDEALRLLSARQVDALIVLGGRLPDERLREVADQLPLVAIGRTVEGLEHRCLCIDNVYGAALGVRHLIERGHRRIAYIAGPSSHRDARDRMTGYRQALSEAGIEFRPELVVEGDFTEQSGLMAMEALFSRAAMVTAIAAANDQMAYGARLALFRHGVRVPDDISLVGFDDLLASAYTTPPLTTVLQPSFEMGWAASQAVLSLLAGEELPTQTMAVRLVVRESTAMCRTFALAGPAAFDSS